VLSASRPHGSGIPRISEFATSNLSHFLLLSVTARLTFPVSLFTPSDRPTRPTHFGAVQIFYLLT